MDVYRFATATYRVRRLMAALCRLVVRIRRLKVILVLGMSRSGTTFLGRALTLDKKRTVYVHEPDRNLLLRHYQKKVPDFDRHSFRQTRDFWQYVFNEGTKPLKLHFLVCVILRQALSRKLERGSAMCLKPITMYDSLEEIAEAVHGSLIFISRHPAGRTESVIRQSMLKRGATTPSIDRLRELGNEWGRVHRMVQRQFDRHDDWIWVYHEHASKEPVEVMTSLYSRLGLTWTKGAERKLRKMTTTEGTRFYGTQRISVDQIDKWRNALTEEQIEAIRSGSKPFDTGLYDGF
jgi:hypothetical protein